MTGTEMKEVADLLSRAVREPEPDPELAAAVAALAARFPAYPPPAAQGSHRA
jgi:glycine/serine hydroxymethyltransferase